jgi:hypothetical protein
MPLRLSGDEDSNVNVSLRPAPLQGTVTEVVNGPEFAGSAPAPTGAHHEEELWLLGLPPLWRFLDFVEHSVVEGKRADRDSLAGEWRVANDYYQELECREAGIANSASHRELDAELAPLAEEVKAHPHFRHTFDTVQTGFGMVELDRLIVRQKHVTKSFVDAQVRRIATHPDPEMLFRICLPLDTPRPPVRICQVSSHRYVFRCESTDLRYHQTILLEPKQVPGYHSFGAVAGMIAVVVGFGHDFLSAVRVGNRLLLDNGYHRACALRALGVTHVPCVIQTVSRLDELQLAVNARVADEAELYFESARPPLLKDFFDPKIRKVLPIRAQTHLVEVHMDVKHLVEDPIESE